jgi:flagella basal body P-ring formation protein FlgA
MTFIARKSTYPAAAGRRSPVGPVVGAAAGLLAAGAIAVACTPAAATQPTTARPSLAAQLQGAVERAVREADPRIEGTTTPMRISAGPVDPRLRLTPCAATPIARLPADAALRPRTSVRVECGGPVRWGIYLPVTIESQVSVLRLQRSVQRGEALGAGDVRSERRWVPGVSVDYVTEISQIDRQHMRRALPVGSVLALSDLQPDPLIRRGSQVELLARLEGIEVRSSGRALGDGGAGERVRVQNETSLKVVEGIVDAENRVRVTPR